MNEGYIFKLSTEYHQTKLKNYSSQIEGISENVSSFFSEDLKDYFIKIKGENLKEKIIKAEELLNKLGIKYELTKTIKPSHPSL